MLAISCFQVEHLQVLRYTGTAAILILIALFITVAMIPFSIFLSIRNKWFISFLCIEAFLIPIMVAQLVSESERY